jgi:aspartyl/asparaginyl-tRNA synthetase
MAHPWYRALVDTQDVLTAATVGYWSGRGLRFGHLPLTTTTVSSPMGLGSDSRPVEIEMFGVRTCLADSMQFGLEYLCRLSSAGAYYLMPSFRGEDVDATHLSQFMHAEAELPGDLDTVIGAVESYVRYLVGELAARCEPQIAAAAGGVDHLARVIADPAPFARITFDEAAQILDNDPAHVHASPDGPWRTLTRAGEHELMRRCGEFLWVTHWDHLAVPFYQAVDHAGRALNADLLFGQGEVVGAGQRHGTGQEVLAALAAHEVSPEAYQWYVAMKHDTPLRTAGFGLGIERFLLWLLRHDDIRDLQIWPRANGRRIAP